MLELLTYNMNITKEVNFAIFKMRLVRVSPAIPEPNIFKSSKWFFFLCYEAQVLDLRKLQEFYYFQLSVEQLFFNVIHTSLWSSLYHWFFFLCAASLLILANTDIKRLFNLLWSPHTLYFWILMLSFSAQALSREATPCKKYIHIITTILHSVRWIFVPVCRWRKWYSQRYHTLPRINQW